jgi:hypothetical protein
MRGNRWPTLEAPLVENSRCCKYRGARRVSSNAALKLLAFCDDGYQGCSAGSNKGVRLGDLYSDQAKTVEG